MGVGDVDERLNRVVQLLLVADGRLVPLLAQLARVLGLLGIPAELAGHQAAGQRAPDQDAEPLVDRERHQFVLGVPAGGHGALRSPGLNVTRP